jgi:hypothetical protein
VAQLAELQGGQNQISTYTATVPLDGSTRWSGWPAVPSLGQPLTVTLSTTTTGASTTFVERRLLTTTLRLAAAADSYPACCDQTHWTEQSEYTQYAYPVFSFPVTYTPLP